MLSPDPEQTTVRVSNRVLYIGATAGVESAAAYPLAGIVRVQWARFAAKNGWAIRSILLNIVAFLIIYKILSAFATYFTGFAEGAGLILAALLAALAIRSWEPIRTLWISRQPYYMLIINTAGSAGTQLMNPDAELLSKIARMIVDAIDNPAADWQIPVTNYHIGDNINQVGHGSIAKVST